MSYHERCEILNQNPVLLARQFQYRVEVFFRTIVLNGPLGKTSYYAIRVEFQLRGSPHIHSFVWIQNAPTLTNDNIEEYKAFIDGIVKADLPDVEENPKLHELVKKYQVHSHTKSCQKYKNKKCRYSFGKFFTHETIIAKPIEETDMERKAEILNKKNNILKPVKEYIDDNLNPRKINIYEDGYICPCIDEILETLGISYDDYVWALSVSSTDTFEIHYKREPNACFVNTYFAEGLLLAWEANMDIQTVISSYAAVNYLCSYLSKHEDEITHAMKEAATNAKELSLNKFEEMKNIARAYITHREISVQEAVYHILPELYLRKTYPRVEFLNTNIPEERVKMCLPKDKLENLDDDCTDIFYKCIIERYMARPDIIKDMCLADLFAHYEVERKPIANDSQPEELNDEILDENHEKRL